MEGISSEHRGPAAGGSRFDTLPRWFPAALAVIAGMVDLTSFVSLGGIFSAHVTGNLVVLAARVTEGAPAKPAQVLIVPLFVVTIAVVWLLVRKIGRGSPGATRVVLLMHFLLLLAVLVVAVVGRAGQFPTGAAALAAVLLAAAAMAAQNALLHLQVTGAPATAMMTGNLVSAVILTLEAISTGGAGRPVVAARLRGVLELLGGFVLGCTLAGIVLLFDRDWAWALPAVLAGGVTVAAFRCWFPSAF